MKGHPPLGNPSPVEYGEWCRGNMGTIGRTVTKYVKSPLGTMPVVDWEDAPPDVVQAFVDREASE